MNEEIDIHNTTVVAIFSNEISSYAKENQVLHRNINIIIEQSLDNQDIMIIQLRTNKWNEIGNTLNRKLGNHNQTSDYLTTPLKNK